MPASGWNAIPATPVPLAPKANESDPVDAFVAWLLALQLRTVVSSQCWLCYALHVTKIMSHLALESPSLYWIMKRLECDGASYAVPCLW